MTYRVHIDIIIKLSIVPQYGEVSERFKELVLKTSDTERYRGFESHLLRHFRGLTGSRGMADRAATEERK